MKIKIGDTVKVISGKDRGTVGKVLTVNHQKRTLVVEGVNKVKKHVRPSQKNPQGGRLSKEMPVDSSIVMALCPKTQAPTRIGYRYLKDGSKERFARKSGASMGEIAPPKAASAQG